MMKKRWVFWFVSVIIVVALMAGCSESTSNNEQVKEPVAQPKEEVKQPDESAGPATKIRWLVRGQESQDHDKVLTEVNKLLKEKINVELKLDVIDSGAFIQKFQLISSSGEDYDITHAAQIYAGIHFTDMVGKGAFHPLNDLLKEYGPTIQAKYSDEYWKGIQLFGEAYGIPMNKPFSGGGVVIQKAMVDKYGLDITKVKSYNDLVPFLEKIRDNEKSLMPYFWDNQPIFQLTHERFNNFVGYPKGSTEYKFVDTYISDAYQAQVQYWADFKNRGFIRSDIYTVGENDAADKKANKYVVWELGYIDEYTAASFSESQKMEYVSINIAPYYVPASSAIGNVAAINARSKNPEAAMKLLNLLFEDKEIYNMLVYGLEGEHYKKVGSNRVEQVPDTRHNYTTLAGQLGDADLRFLTPSQPDGQIEKRLESFNNAEVSKIIGFVLDTKPIEAELSQLSAIRGEVFMEVFLMKNESEVDAYIARVHDRMMKAGLQKVVDEANKQLDTWAKSNGRK